jgi:MEDS: MEthanogen/methylotroph, DcmR Sensory domain
VLGVELEADMTTGAQDEVLGVTWIPGHHICGFYRKPVERDNILVPFLADGLKAGGKCTCVVDSCTPDEVLSRLAERIEVGAYLSDRQLEVLDADGTYLAGGGFLPERMLKFWEAKARQGPSGNDSGFARNIGDMSWAHRDPRAVADLIAYESELNRIMSHFPQVNLCLYNLTLCSGELIMDVLKTHPKVLLGGMVIDNPYYLAPDEFLAARKTTS